MRMLWSVGCWISECLYNILHTNNVSVGNNFWIQSCWIHCKRQWPCVWKCTRRCISIDKTPLLTLCCQNVVVMIANFLRCVHQRHFLPGLGLGAFSSWSDNCAVSSLYGGGQKIWYDIFTQCIVHVQCISMHCKHTTHHDNDKSVWLWISGYDMLLIWIGFKSSKRNVMRYTCELFQQLFTVI